MGLSYMKCAVAGCDKARMLERSYCSEHKMQRASEDPSTEKLEGKSYFRAALAETPAAPREPRVILPPYVKQGFCDRHNRKWEEIDTGDGFAFTCRECRNERIKNHDAPLTALALPEDDVPDTADLAETPATPIRQCRCDVDKGYRDPGCVHCICQSVSDLNGQQRLELNSDCSKHGAALGSHTAKSIEDVRSDAARRMNAPEVK